MHFTIRQVPRRVSSSCFLAFGWPGKQRYPCTSLFRASSSVDNVYKFVLSMRRRHSYAYFSLGFIYWLDLIPLESARSGAGEMAHRLRTLDLGSIPTTYMVAHTYPTVTPVLGLLTPSHRHTFRQKQQWTHKIKINLKKIHEIWQ